MTLFISRATNHSDYLQARLRIWLLLLGPSSSSAGGSLSCRPLLETASPSYRCALSDALAVLQAHLTDLVEQAETGCSARSSRQACSTASTQHLLAVSTPGLCTGQLRVLVHSLYPIPCRDWQQQLLDAPVQCTHVTTLLMCREGRSHT